MRSSLALALTLALASSQLALAQGANSQLRPVVSAPRDAGTYHLATRTWSRGPGSVALAGPDVLYDNTCTVGYYFGLSETQVSLDSGRIPSTSSPTSPTSLTGTHDNYLVNGFTIAYCSYEPLVTSMDISFYDAYAACSDASEDLPTPLVTLSILNAPATTTALGGCWIVHVDLSNTQAIFQLAGDGNGTFDDDPLTDSFGWSWTQSIPTTASDSGPILAGDPQGYFNNSSNTCGGLGAGTTFPTAAPGPGSGLGVLDQLEAGLTTGPFLYPCHWFGGYSPTNPYASLYLQLEGGAAPGAAPAGDAYCSGDGTSGPCPCGAAGGIGEGCANTTGAGAVLVGTGSASFSNDTLQFDVTGVPGTKPGLLLRADNAIAVPAGDGILCLAGGSQRSQVTFTSGGQATLTDFSAESFGMVSNVGGPTHFQFWYRDPANTCSGAGFNFTNGWSVTYQL